MNDPVRVRDEPDFDFPSIGTDDSTEPRSRGLEEAAAIFDFRPPANSIAVPLRKTVASVGSPALPFRPTMPGRRIKRAMDLIGALLLLAVFAVPMALIALVLSAGGPVFFTQSRVGRGRSRFDCLKFRTMHVDAQARLAAVLASDDSARAEWQVHQKLSDDPRVTRIGRWLRQSSLDELPQLFNILRGEMSLVGPRPIVAPEIDGYPSDLRYFNSPAFEAYARCLPGLTGLWQVVGRHRAAHADRVALDDVYARERTVAMDLKILWRTVGVVLSGSGR